MQYLSDTSIAGSGITRPCFYDTGIGFYRKRFGADFDRTITGSGFRGQLLCGIGIYDQIEDIDRAIRIHIPHDTCTSFTK